MKAIVQTLTPAAEEALKALAEKGEISLEVVDPTPKPATDFEKAWNAMAGLLTREEGEELIARIRYERDHDWE